MATPKINLIPAGYYERKKATAAAWCTGVALVAVIGGLLYYNQTLQQKKDELTAQEQEWSARKQAVDDDMAAAQTKRDDISDVSKKVTFVNDCFKTNAAWSDIFVAFVRYSHPSMQYTSIKPTAASPLVALKVRVPSQVVLSQYWTNLLRCPIVDKAAPSQMIGGGSLAPVGQAVDTGAEGAQPVYAGGPSGMPGSPMPGMPSMPGVARMPGGMPSSGMPGGATPTESGTEMTQLLGSDGQPIAGLESLPESLLRQFRTPNTYEIEFSAVISKPVTLPTFGGQQVTDTTGQAA